VLVVMSVVSGGWVRLPCAGLACNSRASESKNCCLLCLVDGCTFRTPHFSSRELEYKNLVSVVSVVSGDQVHISRPPLACVECPPTCLTCNWRLPNLPVRDVCVVWQLVRLRESRLQLMNAISKHWRLLCLSCLAGRCGSKANRGRQVCITKLVCMPII
jgi:hypothetical protein